MASELCPSCGSCGFPMREPADFAGGDPAALYCSTCATADGRLRPYAEVVEANADYFVRQQGVDPAAARAMAEALLAAMPAWKSPTSISLEP